MKCCEFCGEIMGCNEKYCRNCNRMTKSKNTAPSDEAAKEIAKELGVPFEEKLLSRPFQGKEQKTLGGIERFGGVIGAFDCAENKITENAAVLLCDDISTTGATLNECAKLLLLRGADKVYCVSAAITKKEDGKCSEQTSE